MIARPGQHDALIALLLESVRAIFTKARPLIGAMSQPLELRPVGGRGLD